MSQPVLEEGSDSVAVEEMENEGMKMETTIELMPEIENEDGQLLQEMYRIQVVARWFESGVAQEQMAGGGMDHEHQHHEGMAMPHGDVMGREDMPPNGSGTSRLPANEPMGGN